LIAGDWQDHAHSELAMQLGLAEVTGPGQSNNRFRRRLRDTLVEV
jgi:hypothetical protein